ncbi:hypothetical protein GCM10011497_22730 [Elstera cyanobacteriorum]|uniref:Glycosyltransferase subfamily 4-like N-terminal domain-containing protein n=1 Tax=Elstera cyanobacteriorum TaxID=2022747 RepID=A0A255XRD0_9PROT|nr:glycosyltransferase family 4 protein [Elstera cyanobacteriorum]OYQ19528.1 hypothetical protein CHR90_08935 [Elstera cyanobacteriorum]GFZ92216.1 hypothetical protein GCM10011497_22730 [Elstera cyanobacteriorum]
MRLLVHDFGCYAFIIPLARWFAAQGHEVLHLSARDLIGPKGAPSRTVDDPAGLTFDTVALGRPFRRYSLPRRLWDEARYGRGLAAAITAFQPDLILSANTPPLAQALAAWHSRRLKIPFVPWVQDIFSLGAAPMVGTLPAPLAGVALAALRWLEFGPMRRAAGVITIAPTFVDNLAAAGVRHPQTLVQENWAVPLPTPPAPTAWAEGQGLGTARILLAAGTLGQKHDPELLAHLATGLADDPRVRLVVVSEGPGRDRLEALKAAGALPHLVLRDYQPAAQVPAMLASAEIGIVQLCASANGMSIPSKVYSYAAAGLPILAAIPSDNHAAHLIRTHGLGLVVGPDDVAGFLAAARRLLDDPALRLACRAAGLSFTAEHGNIDRIGQRMMAFLNQVRHRDGSTLGSARGRL